MESIRGLYDLHLLAYSRVLSIVNPIRVQCFHILLPNTVPAALRSAESEALWQQTVQARLNRNNPADLHSCSDLTVRISLPGGGTGI